MPRVQHSQSYRFARPNFHLVPPSAVTAPAAPPTSTNVDVTMPPLANDLNEMRRTAAVLNAALRQANWKALRMAHLRRRAVTSAPPPPLPYVTAQSPGAPTPPLHESGVQKLADELRKEKLVRKLQNGQTHSMTEGLSLETSLSGLSVACASKLFYIDEYFLVAQTIVKIVKITSIILSARNSVWREVHVDCRISIFHEEDQYLL
uniref:Uncharacterized protein n=1 Tax=Romanomermis culicivorax TaxID=13658 RepID=A0A915K1P4_ROMCU